MNPQDNVAKRFDFIDVTLRDAHQCLWSTRMTTAMMTPILGAIDGAGYAYRHAGDAERGAGRTLQDDSR